MLDMLEDEEYADIEFHVGQGDHQRIFCAHSQILMTRSSFSMQGFIEIAKEDQYENKKRKIDEDRPENAVIQLPNVDPVHFEPILHFIYAEDLSILETEIDLKKLLATANKFGCWQLKMHVEAKLIQENLDFGSSIELVVLADAQNCFMLKEAAIAEIVRNFTDRLGHHDFPKLAGAPEIFQEMHRYAKNSGEEDASEKNKYSSMTISELYRELEKRGTKIESDGSREMLLKRLPSSK